MRRSKRRQALSPRDFAAQSNEIESELLLVREVRDLWIEQARGIGKDRQPEFQRQIDRLEQDLDELRKRARRTDNGRVGTNETGNAAGTVGQAWGD